MWSWVGLSRDTAESRSAGRKLEDYFRQHIFAPLQMSDTSYNVPQEKAPRLVAAQQRAGERMFHRRRCGT